MLGLPLRGYEGPIHFVDKDEDVPPAVEALERETLLGFDTETRPSFRVGESYPPALVQLAGAHSVFIFQLRPLRHIAPLFSLLSAASITKAGLALADDLKKLRGLHAFEAECFVDIARLARERGFRQTGLRPLAAMLLGFRVSKREQRSNWGRPDLTRSQLRYAATDAWVTRELYQQLTAMPVRHKPAHPHAAPKPE